MSPLQAGAIDCHIHSYPPAAALDPRGWGTALGEAAWVSTVAPSGRRGIQGWADCGRLLRDMDHAGLERCVILGWYWEHQQTCELHNAWTAGLVRDHPDRLSGFASVQPRGGKGAIESLERSLDAGLCGIGELLPVAQGYRVGDPHWEAVVAVAVRRGIPVNLHVTDPSAGPGAGPPTPLGDIVATGLAHPDLKLILAHLGGGLVFKEATDPTVRTALRNAVYDTAACPLLYDAGVYRRAVDAAGPGRILFGSDYPLLVHPRKTREPGFATLLGEVGASLCEAERTRVLRENTRRVLGLP